MSRSGRSNVVTWLTSNVFGVRPLAAVKPTAFLFSAVRLSMPFARLSDRVTRKTLKLFRKPRRSSLRYLCFLLLALVLANQKKLLTEGSEGNEDGFLPRENPLCYLRFLLLVLVFREPERNFYRRQRRKRRVFSNALQRVLQKTAKQTKMVFCFGRNPFAIFVSFCLRFFLYQRRYGSAG